MITRTRFAGTMAGLLMSLAIATAPVLAASAPDASARGTSDPHRRAGAATIRIHCTAEWLAAKANPTVENLQKVGFCEIDRRLVTIDRLQAAISTARALTDEHEAALADILNADERGLIALRAEIAADTTVAELRADIKSIFADYRIYVLVVRQVWLVRGDDLVDAAGARLTNAAGRLGAAIEQAAASGKDVSEAREHLGKMEAAVAAALAEVDGDAEAVLALTPADWNAGTAEPLLRAARASIGAARADLKVAMSEARAVLAALH